MGEYLTSETAVRILLEDNPLAGDGDSCNLDIKVWNMIFVVIDGLITNQFIDS